MEIFSLGSYSDLASILRDKGWQTRAGLCFGQPGALRMLFTLKRNECLFYTNTSRKSEEGNTPNSFHGASITLKPKPVKDITKQQQQQQL